MAKALVLGGASGLLGKALTQVLRLRGWEVDNLGRAEGNLLDKNFLRQKLDDTRPDAVFNAVAWTDVDGAEDNEASAHELNCNLPRNLALALNQIPGALLYHFSTDFIFSDDQQVPLSETALPNPQSVYARTKLAGEEAICENLPKRSCILRTAWLFGPGKKNFVATILGLAKNSKALRVVADQKGSPTYTADLALWAAQLAEKKACGLWHTVNSGEASWHELAQKAVGMKGFPCQVEAISSGQWPQKAVRPKYSVLNNSKLAEFLGFAPRSWKLALKEYLDLQSEELLQN